MPVRNDFRLVAEVRSWEDEVPLGAFELTEPDWDPALQCAYFAGVRRGVVPPLMRCPSGTVAPMWHGERGRPYVEAFRVRPDGNASDLSVDLPTSYVRHWVEEGTRALVTRGVLEEGAPFHYRLCAYGREGRAAGTPLPEGVCVDTLTEPLPLAERRLPTRGAVRRGTASWDDVDVPVFVPADVVEEISSLAQASPEVETGGLLVGRLFRDPDAAEVFVRVTAQIPARHTQAARERLTFTSDTWAAARVALQLRGEEGEIVAGWHHSHPDMCAGCPDEARRACPLSRPFLSREDRALHRTMFGRPFDLAFLAADLGPRGQEIALFGWRDGFLVRRGFWVEGAPADAGAESVGPSEPAAVPRSVASAVPHQTDLHSPGSGSCGGTHVD